MNIVEPELGSDGRILEGIVTTHNVDGTVNISPMGPIVDGDVTRFVFRPYVMSTTYANLKREGRGVFHVTDDVMLFAQAAVGQPDPLPALEGLKLLDACRWYEFAIRSLDDSTERTHVVAETVDNGRFRDFFGFNRAKHAVIEAAILATRVHLLPPANICADLERLATPVQKTAGLAEQQAFTFLQDFISAKLQTSDSAESI